MQRICALVFAVGLLILGVGGTDAGASCMSPSVSFDPHEVGRGTAIVVTGSSFGDACYDTGSPPPGVGMLGNPLGDIQVIVAQGTSEWVVARGSADANYHFEVGVTIPSSTSPGSAELVVRWLGGQAVVTDPTFTITDAPPLGDDPLPAEFGSFAGAPSSRPESIPATVSPPSEPETGSSMTLVAVAVAGVGATLIGVWAVRRRRD